MFFDNRIRIRKGVLLIALTLIALTGVLAASAAPRDIELEAIGNYRTGIFDEGASEIIAYDPGSHRLFSVNAADVTIDILDLSDPTSPTLINTIDATAYGDSANSVAVHDGVVAVAIQADPKTDPGKVVFFDVDGNYLNDLAVGALPDMVTFTAKGAYVLVANEGEPNDDYSVDPNGSVSIIKMRSNVESLRQKHVRTATFTQFNNQALDPSIRIFGPDATVAQDIEPEYIATSDNQRTAWVTLQENNAVAIINIPNARVTSLVGLGFKDHSQPGNELDASDEDGEINIADWPVYGMFLPDAIAAYRAENTQYFITANEGDAREYDTFEEETRVEDLLLDPAVFPDFETLQAEENLGRLNVTATLGNTDGDEDYEALYSFGARSFTIWDASGNLVFDSGDALEQITAAALPADFNSDGVADSFDSRSDNKGPEPEAVTIGKIDGRPYAFIGLERIGGVVVYDVTHPRAPRFIQYINTANFTGDPEADAAGDIAPESIAFISEQDSPIDAPLLAVGNEVSGSIAIFRININ